MHRISIESYSFHICSCLKIRCALNIDKYITEITKGTHTKFVVAIDEIQWPAFWWPAALKTQSFNMVIIKFLFFLFLNISLLSHFIKLPSCFLSKHCFSFMY